MKNRKGFTLALTALATAMTGAGFTLALGDDDEESKLHKAMEQVQAKQAYILKNIKSEANFKKNQKEIVEAAKTLAKLGKDTRDETGPAKEMKKPQEDWVKLMDEYVKESEKFAEAAEKADAKQPDVKKAYQAVQKTCTECHKEFRPDE